MSKPTKRDLAGSAADLRGYAVLFRGIATSADDQGRCQVDAGTVLSAADFFDAVVEELLALIEEEPIALGESAIGSESDEVGNGVNITP